MSGFISRRYVKQQDIQEGQVPDNQSDRNQAAQQPSQSPQTPHPNPEYKKKQTTEDQFIFETVTDAQLQHQYKQKNNPKNWQYHHKNNKKQWDKNHDKHIIKQKQKKQNVHIQTKKKQQIEEIRQPPMNPTPLQMNYYPLMSLPSHVHPHSNYMPPGPIPPVYYQGYPPPQMLQLPSHLARPGYYPPNIGMYSSPSPVSLYPPGPYPVSHMYPPHIYNVPNVYNHQNMSFAAINEQAYRAQNSQNLSIKQPIKYYEKQTQNYERPDRSIKPPSIGTKSQNGTINRAQDKHQITTSSTGRYSQDRDRSRDIKQRVQRKQKYQNIDKFKEKKQKHLKKQIQQQKNQLKQSINKRLNLVFDSEQSKEEFLYILRDILKQVDLNKEDQSRNPTQFGHTYGKQSMMKLQKLILQFQKVYEDNAQNKQKKENLFAIIALLNIESILIKIRENRLRKKMIGDKKTSDIKRLLDELVKEPSRKVK